MVLDQDGNAVPTCVNAMEPGSSLNARVLRWDRRKEGGMGVGLKGKLGKGITFEM